MSYTTHQMPGGGVATVIHRKASTDKTLLVHFGFRNNSFMICGFCGGGRVFNVGEKPDDASEWMYLHCVNHRKGRGILPAHPGEEMITKKVLTKLLRETSNPDRESSMGRSRSRLLSEQFLQTILDGSVLQSMTKHRGIVVGYCCLVRADVRVNCCIERLPMTVDIGLGSEWIQSTARMICHCCSASSYGLSLHHLHLHFLRQVPPP